MRNRGVRMTWGAATALTLVACGSGGQTAMLTSTDETSTTPEAAFTSAPPVTTEPRAKNWFDLDAGDCLFDLPRVDLGEVWVGSSPHQRATPRDRDGAPHLRSRRCRPTR